MPFQFGKSDLPVSLKLTRSLLFTQVVLLIYAVLIYVLLVVINFGPSNNSTTVTNSGNSTALEGVLVVVGIVLGYLAIELRKTKVATRNVIVVVEVALLIAYVIAFRTELFSMLFVAAIVGGIIYSLYTPSAQAAFASAPAAPATPTTPDVATPAVAETPAPPAVEAAAEEETSDTDAGEETSS